MEVEKRSSKGGFLQLFDWNVKSRKKLFSNKSELYESSKQGRESYKDSTILRLQKVHENGCGPSTRGNIDLNYASSVNADERYGSRAPGVVARLMGLNSLPTSNASEPCITPFFDSHSFRDSHFSRGIPDFRSEEHIVIYDSMRNKLDGLNKNHVEVMLQKVQGRPIEKFQTEVLPPKSAKPISITHHKLLSPIKSPGFIPTMNAAYLMEAAAKIIEQSPRLTATHKLPSLGSSTVPLRIQDLKEKMEDAQKSKRILEASQKAKGQNSSKHIKRQPKDRIQGRGEARDRVSHTSRNAGSQSLKNKEKSVSLAVQAKAIIQKKEGFTSVGNRSFINQKEHNDVKYSSASRNQPNSQNNIERRTSTNRPSDVLKQNNQKQNCASNKDKDGLRPSFFHQKDVKLLPTNDVPRPSKTVNKIVVSTPVTSRKTSINHVGKEQPPIAMKKSSAKKQPVNGNSLANGNSNSYASQGERSIKCNFETERCTKWDAAVRKNGMDVVSFTFTSPIKKSLSASTSPVKVVEKKQSSFTSSTSENQSSCGLNLSGGDALSMLLEQKLKELTSKVESSNQDLVPSEFLCGSANCYKDSESSLNMKHTKSAENEQKFQLGILKDKPDIQCKFDGSSFDELQLKAAQMCQGVEEMGEHSSISNSEYEGELRYQSCCTVSSLEPAFSECSYNSLDSNVSMNSEASKKFVSVEAHEMNERSSTRKSQHVEADIELSDSASSTSLGATSLTDISSSLITNESSQWELEYIRCILMNTDLIPEEFALGQVHRIVAPDLFIQLGEEKLGSDKNVDENFKLVRKVLFDYVEESLELRSAQLFNGSRKSWAKSKILYQSKDWLAEELCREISGWTSMEDFMVDELVDKDMSTHLGKWVDFETEAFEEGVEIEKRILSYLVDELVDDFLLS